jgi:hypothetical protein
MGLVAGELVVVGAFAVAKLGNVKESLPALKVFNLLQAAVAATVRTAGAPPHPVHRPWDGGGPAAWLCAPTHPRASAAPNLSPSTCCRRGSTTWA